MKAKNTDIIMQNKVFVWIAVGTAAILSIPLAAMQVTSDVTWGSEDFFIMGVLIFALSSLFVLVARVVPAKYRTLTGVGFVMFFLWLWVELAVGVYD